MQKYKFLGVILYLAILAIPQATNGSTHQGLDTEAVPKDIWGEITKYLKINQKAKFSQVCKHFRGLICSELAKEKKEKAEFDSELKSYYESQCTNINQGCSTQLLELPPPDRTIVLIN
jgi:hypothetical protein